MISRIVTTMALMATTALVCLPAQAQTGTTAQSTVNSGGASPTGSVGTTSNTPRDNSSSTSTTMGQTGGGTTNSPGMSGTTGAGTAGATTQGTTMGTGTSGTTMGTGTSGTTMGTGTSTTAQGGTMHRPGHQARTPSSGAARGGIMVERQMTDCLNTAAAQNQPLDSCKR